MAEPLYLKTVTTLLICYTSIQHKTFKRKILDTNKLDKP